MFLFSNATIFDVHGPQCFILDVDFRKKNRKHHIYDGKCGVRTWTGSADAWSATAQRLLATAHAQLDTAFMGLDGREQVDAYKCVLLVSIS